MILDESFDGWNPAIDRLISVFSKFVVPEPTMRVVPTLRIVELNVMPVLTQRAPTVIVRYFQASYFCFFS